jgi:UDP-N-acetylmuramate dehydrogenase
MKESYQKLIAQFPSIEQNKPLAPLTSIGIGGLADLFLNLADTSQLEQIITAAKTQKIPYFILGGGSNTIFADEGFRGLMIHFSAKTIALVDAQTVSAEAGALLSQVIQFALKNNLTGIEKMMGVPGTIGGAVRGNAGAFGVEIKDIFQKALLYSPEKGLFEADSKYMEFSYRSSIIKEHQGDSKNTKEIILKLFLKLKSADQQTIKSAQEEATNIIKNRISKQPKGKSSGSFFKNPVTPDYGNPQPPETKAGYLLEQIGAKGMQIGGVQVSPEHANWLMNVNNGTQKDVLELCRILQNKVKEKFGVQLEREVQLVSAEGILL